MFENSYREGEGQRADSGDSFLNFDIMHLRIFCFCDLLTYSVFDCSDKGLDLKCTVQSSRRWYEIPRWKTHRAHLRTVLHLRADLLPWPQRQTSQDFSLG